MTPAETWINPKQTRPFQSYIPQYNHRCKGVQRKALKNPGKQFIDTYRSTWPGICLSDCGAKPEKIIFTPVLPETLSGKIMRRLLRDIAMGKVMGDTTLADPDVLNRIKKRCEED